MAARRSYYSTYYPGTRRRVRRRRKRGFGLGDLGSFGQTRNLRASLGSIKSVLITGGIAAGGAIVTDRVFAMIQEKFPNLRSYQAAIAKMATGIALGLVIAKVLKKPQLAAAFAIGPVVAGILDIVNEITEQRALEGLGFMTTALPQPYVPSSMYSGAGLGEVSIGPSKPAWMAPGAYAFPGAA